MQALLDMGLMILSALGYRAGGYRDVGPALNRLSLLSRKDSELLRSMAGLRNVLVQGYAAVNRDTVLDASKRLPGDALRIASSLMKKAEASVLDPETTTTQLVEKLKTV